jgi:hypothetical protein
MAMDPRIYAITVTSGERRQLERLIERHGTPAPVARLRSVGHDLLEAQLPP